jgi:hypothetical protein
MLISGPPALSRKIVTAVAEAGDQLMDVSGGDRVQAAGRLVEEQDLRVAGQQPSAKAIRWHRLSETLPASPAG